MLRILSGPMPESLWCAEGGEGGGGLSDSYGGEGEGGRAGAWGGGGGGLVGYMPVGVTAGSVEHHG